jgi:FecR protein
MSDDWSAWEPEEPPRGFAERVVDAARADRATANAAPARQTKRAWTRTALVAATALALAASAALVLRPAAPAGDAEAKIRKEIVLGPRAVAVLEPGARIAWRGDHVTQTRGNVFYRVEPGAAFSVETAAGDVTVKGTCFRVKVREETTMNAREARAGVLGAALGAAALVGVYEGKVALSQPKGGSVDVTAGHSAMADSRGVRSTGSLDDGDRVLADGAPVSSSGDEPLLAANASLADSVRAYKTRLELLEDEKKKLEKDLSQAQAKLAEAEGGATLGGPKKSDFDLSQDDWKQLAKEGQVKARYPCQPRPGDYGPKALDKMGLKPDDGKIINAAFDASAKRRWAVIRPLCAQALGGAVDVADKVGEGACIAIVQTISAQKDRSAADEGVRLAAEVRAGLRPMPGPDEAINPVERMMIALTGESKAVETDLAKSLGPDDANRIVFGDTEGCWKNNGWGVGPRAATDTPAP